MTKEDEILAKRMFLAGGGLLLPFLWIANTMHYYERVFGKAPWLLSLCLSNGDDRDNDNDENDDNDDENDNGDLISYQAGQLEGGDVRPSEQRQSASQGDDDEDEVLKIWVRRSATGSVLSMVLFVVWTVMFQLLSGKEDSFFGLNWFVMSADEEELSGW